MDIIKKVAKKGPLVKTIAIKVNDEILKDLADFEKEFPGVDMGKLKRAGLYLAMEAVRKESK